MTPTAWQPSPRFSAVHVRLVFASLLGCLLFAAPATAQPIAEPIPRFVVDLHGSTVGFKNSAAVADGLGVAAVDLPGRGFGGDIAVQVYPLALGGVTFGLGGSVSLSRSSAQLSDATTAFAPGSGIAVRFTAYSPQLSFNFGSGGGWSYISGGLGVSKLAYSIDGTALDTSPRRKTINYGAGARWFLRDHLAFSLDVRAYAINPVAASADAKASPRMTLVVVAAGVSFK